MIETSAIEIELQKVVSMTATICTTEEYTVNWEDILSELEAYVEKGCAPRDTARFTAEIVREVKERANDIEQFLPFATTGEAAEYLTLYALCRVGIAATGEDPESFIRAALNAASISVNKYLMSALVEAATSSISENGEGETPSSIDVSALLLDDTDTLSELICQTRDLVEDPAWVVRVALEQALKSVAPSLEK